MTPRPKTRSNLPCDWTEMTRQVLPRNVQSTVRRFAYGIMYASTPTQTRRLSARPGLCLRVYYSRHSAR